MELLNLFSCLCIRSNDRLNLASLKKFWYMLELNRICFYIIGCMKTKRKQEI